MSDTISILKDWSKSSKLSEVIFSEHGALQLGDASLQAADSVEVAVGGDKTCNYTVGSIFLQLLDVKQSLLTYRKACKKHQVKDAIKVSDKAEIIAYFTGSSGAAATEAGPSTSTTAAPPEAASHPAGESSETATRERERGRDRHHDEKKRHRSSSEREKDKHRSSKKRELSRTSSRPPSSDRKEKAHKPIDPEMLFSNLSVVVGKREIKAKRDAEQAKLHQALSTEGFGAVAPEIIAKFNNQDSMAHEIPVGDSASILKAGAGKDLSRILKLYTETMEKKTSSSGKHSSSSSSKGRPSYDGGQKKSWRQYLVGKKPIIVLPKGMTSPLTLVNAHKFFAESQFVNRANMQKELRSKRQVPKTQFSRQINSRYGGGTAEYELMDNPKSKLHRPEDWDRVVAVVALGQSWQMKDWPGSYSNPVQLFNRVFGFYVGMEGDNIPKELQGWAVTQNKVSRDKRGMDSISYASFWNALDEWMAIHKPELLPQPNE
uniref:Cell division control protein 73 C-terminal domain-containing protein n=1 Tax=Pseudo-nitzschia australis TaxID=44445 RepID=A0A7S4ANR7_9STRA|mmetsp:Transcript_19339/g.42077  ORF Transcript_19339/g.42077 Transcript_19339/m.42077 type:complete len:489 (+) Transcript_19339:238-1704(+)|eukprot:CAMPEP_0168253994 /NCGR_PEP_ID=MMETSP0141_2-20121125/4509_1 /TAXON_ID=44445 /ORGANISM="Pseudo-nitzschia australis, Strain 10249 10 AB" /LENGTH=488 /DNA_ID=CAMNT_0008190447 /DNA_START=206 /DNA_END=1675 /DNA_ORIENTATION=+